MRVLIAMLKHETNTFSPVRTDLARFAAWGLKRGPEVVAAYRGTGMPTAAFIDLAEARGAEIVAPVAAEAMPGGYVEEDAYEELVEAILAPVRAGGVDAAFLDLHGAMTARHVPDGEGELLARIRAIAPDLPIAVTYDMHGNLTARMVANCTIMNGYKTYPHVDMAEVGRRAGEILWDAIEGRVRPVMAWGAVPVLAQTLRMGTSDEPMRALQELTRALEREPGILSATVLGGFPMADVPHAGASAIVVADGDQGIADAARDRLCAAIWAQRAELIYRHKPIAAQIKAAEGVNAAPIVLLDHADNVGSGGTSDVMGVIGQVLAAGLDRVAVAAVWDPDAVRRMQAAGLGATVTLDLGGRTAMPSIGLAGQPLRLTGSVQHLADGRWVVRGPMYTGVTVDTGPTAVLKTGGVQIVVTSHHHEPWDAGILSNNGIDPLAQRFILLKSRIHYRAGFAPLAKAHFTLDGDGVTTSDNSRLSYERLRRPIYPLDPEVRWPA